MDLFDAPNLTRGAGKPFLSQRVVFVIGTKERPSLLHLEETCAALAAADQSRTEVDQVTCDAIRQRIGRCDRRLEQCRKLLDEGGDPKSVAS